MPESLAGEGDDHIAIIFIAELEPKLHGVERFGLVVALSELEEDEVAVDESDANAPASGVLVVGVGRFVRVLGEELRLLNDRLNQGGTSSVAYKHGFSLSNCQATGA